MTVLFVTYLVNMSNTKDICQLRNLLYYSISLEEEPYGESKDEHPGLGGRSHG